jgi:hypothetical protein
MIGGVPQQASEAITAPPRLLPLTSRRYALQMLVSIGTSFPGGEPKWSASSRPRCHAGSAEITRADSRRSAAVAAWEVRRT